MGSSFSIQIKGLDKLQKKIGGLPKAIGDIADGQLERASQLAVVQAKSNAPKGRTGGLQQSIDYKGGNLNYKIIARIRYAPYQEWGTGKFVKVYPEQQNYAAQFKGSGKRQVNIKPREFFFSSINKFIPAAIKNIEQEINKVLQ